MVWSKEHILDALDRCSENSTFPMLDNGYVYPAACRLSAFRSNEDWHLTIEVFGFSPRAGIPDTNIYHFGSNIVRLKKPENFVTPKAFENFLKSNANNESDFVFPIDGGDWISAEFDERVAPEHSVSVRGTNVPIPTHEEFARLGIKLEDPPNIFVYELCRAIASTHRNLVLATDDELRKLVPPDLELILRLDEWHHPDIVNPAEKPSENKTFQEIAEVLESGNVSKFDPDSKPNTHWSNWPEGGQL